MKIRTIQRSTVALILTAALILLASTHSFADRPNFIIVLCDDLGYGDLACFGSKIIRTPNLDRFAAEGAKLTDCYSAAPVCSPSRAGMMTGRTPTRSGVYDWIPGNSVVHLRRNEVTIASLLKNAGYATCHVGKWHLNGMFNSPDQPQPSDHGFDHWFSTQNNAAPSHRNPRNFVRNGREVGEIEGYACQIVADEAIDWLKNKRDRDRPFFQFVCFHEPHEPVASPPDLVAMYPNATKPGEAEYYANVTNMDAAFGRLMKAVDDLGLRDNTLVFFTSDNGPETLNRYPGAAESHGSPGPLRGWKLWLYEGGIRVPGLMRYPGHIKPGSVIGQPICSLDVLPTFCELAGAKVPVDRPIDGMSFTAIFEGKPIARHTPLFWHYYRSLGWPKAVMRDGDYKIVGLWDAGPLGPGGQNHPEDSNLIKSAKLVDFELYNLAADQVEMTNLAHDDSPRLRRMAQQLKHKHDEVVADGPVWPQWPKPRAGRKN